MTTRIQSSFAPMDAISKGKVWLAYGEYAAHEDIMDEAYNENSGYYYIALENGVTIASAFGEPVVYFVIDFKLEQEFSFDSYSEALLNFNQFNEED